MGAHSTFEQALAGVTAFASAVQSDSEPDTKRRGKSSKSNKKSSKKERKDKKNGVSSFEKKKAKNKKKKRRQISSSSEAEGSDSEDETLDVQLERGRAATRCTREVMAYFPSAKAILRQMFWRLDNKEAVNISAVSDDNLKALLEILFNYLRLFKAKEGIFVKRKTKESILGLLGHVLEEDPAVPSKSKPNPPKPQDAQPAKAAAETVKPEKEGSGSQAACSPVAGGASIGPALPEGFVERPADGEEEGRQTVGDQPAKRVVGPAVPPQELLDQAAEVAEAMAAEEAALAAEVLIGPPPPQIMEEVNAVAGDVRTAEVSRVLTVLEAATREGKEVDAYEVVGMDPQAAASDIRKRYWRLSLMIHPDKCSHPAAQQAFDAVSKAAKSLQDAGQRESIDKGRQAAEFAAFEREEAAKEERARQWRVAQGQASQADLRGPASVGPPSREEWITALPAARRPSAPSQKSQTAFAQQGVAAVEQDRSSWADTPSQKLLRLQQAGAAMLPSAGPSEFEQEKAAAKAEAVDKYNQAHRGQTLVEQHAARQKTEKKRSKKQKQEEEEGKEGGKDWADSHPWRPFDREKDLQVSSKPTNRADYLKQMGDLSARFGSSAASRKFL